MRDAIILQHPTRLHPGSLQEVATAEPPHPHLDGPEMMQALRTGLPLVEFDALRELLGLTVEALAPKVGISVATLARRRHDGAPLDPAHGDRVVRYARLFWQAAQLFDYNESTARDWLRRPATALGGATPLDYAETEPGAREVENLIGRLEYGVYN